MPPLNHGIVQPLRRSSGPPSTVFVRTSPPFQHGPDDTFALHHRYLERSIMGQAVLPTLASFSDSNYASIVYSPHTFRSINAMPDMAPQYCGIGEGNRYCEPSFSKQECLADLGYSVVQTWSPLDIDRTYGLEYAYVPDTMNTSAQTFGTVLHAPTMMDSGYKDATQPGQITFPFPATSIFETTAPGVLIGTVYSTDKTDDFVFRCGFLTCVNRSFKRWYDLKRHHDGAHAVTKPAFWCHVGDCERSAIGGRSFPRKDKLHDHVRKMH
jgi:hypothetical protein